MPYAGAPREGPEIPDGLHAAPPAEPEIGNDDVLAMTAAGFAPSTIVAAIRANDTRFDVAPSALLALKEAGVADAVLEAMLEAAAAKRAAAAGQPASSAPGASEPAADGTAEAAGQVSAETVALLAQMVGQLAAAQPAEPAERGAESPALDRAPPAPDVPQAWLARGDERLPLEPAVAEVALTDSRGLGGNALRTLQGLAGKALAFANPALGLASTLGGFLRQNDEEQTAVWALPGPSASRAFDPSPVFEIEFGAIPGVNPDEYRPAIVRLVPTSDNYRLVGAAEAVGGPAGLEPTGPIVEEPVPAVLTRVDRGRYRVALDAPLGPGEYALVLRPLPKKERGRRRGGGDSSLGALLGGGASRILYLTWDFSVVA